MIKELFDNENVLRYYVGTSRARLKLDIVTILSSDDCTEILKNKFKSEEKIKKPQKELARALNAQVMFHE